MNIEDDLGEWRNWVVANWNHGDNPEYTDCEKSISFPSKCTENPKRGDVVKEQCKDDFNEVIHTLIEMGCGIKINYSTGYKNITSRKTVEEKDEFIKQMKKKVSEDIIEYCDRGEQYERKFNTQKMLDELMEEKKMSKKLHEQSLNDLLEDRDMNDVKSDLSDEVMDKLTELKDEIEDIEEELEKTVKLMRYMDDEELDEVLGVLNDEKQKRNNRKVRIIE